MGRGRTYWCAPSHHDHGTDTNLCTVVGTVHGVLYKGVGANGRAVIDMRWCVPVPTPAQTLTAPEWYEEGEDILVRT